MGLNLPGNAIRALELLGVAEQVASAGVPVRRREYRNGADRLLFETQDADFWRGVGAPLCVRHGHLLRALEGSVSVERDTRVVNARSLPDRVEIQFQGEPSPRSYDFVVGADGVHSAVRSAVETTVPRTSAMTQSSWRFIVPNPGVDCWTAWSGPQGTCLLIPVDATHVYGYASSTRGRDTGRDPRWLERAFAGFPQPVRQAVDAVRAGTDELHHAPVVEVRLERWHSGRVVLIGDAAHAMGPVWAQGVALAIEDALVLADLLTSTANWSGVGYAFEQRRRERVERVQAATDKFSRLARLPTWLRDQAAPKLGPKAYRAVYEPLRQEPP